MNCWNEVLLMREEFKLISRRKFPHKHIATIGRDFEDNAYTYYLKIHAWHPRFAFELCRGITKFDSEMTLNFVRNRVYESEYDWIDKVLVAYGLKYYDAWELFKAMKAECAYDDLTINEDYENTEEIIIRADSFNKE